MNQSQRTRRPPRADRSYARKARDPWAHGIAWGPLSPFLSAERSLAEFRRDPWNPSLLRSVVEEEAERLRLDINDLFRVRRADARGVVRRLASTGVLTLKGCDAVAMLLLIMTCRDPELPEAGRRHAMSLLAGVDLRQRRDPRSPTAAEFVGATWTAMRSLAAAAVVDASAWTAGDVVFDGEHVGQGEYHELVMAPGIGPKGVAFH